MAEVMIRFDGELKDWEVWKARAKAKYGTQIIQSRPFLKDHLSHLEGIEIKFRIGATIAEKRELNILRAKRREIEKILYPGLLSRLSYRLVQRFVVTKMQKKQQVTRAGNAESLASLLSQKGFGRIDAQLDKQIKSGVSEFRIPVALQMNEKDSMHYDLQFKREHDGLYQLKEVRATLKNHMDGKSSSMLFTSIPDQDLTARQSYNLLAGRSVEKHQGWYVLDINDRDAQGNLKAKVFPWEYGFSLEKLLDHSNVKGLRDPVIKDSILSDLRNGDVVSVRSGKTQIELEANPQHNSLENPDVLIAKRETEKQAGQTVRLEKEQISKVAKAKMSIR